MSFFKVDERLHLNGAQYSLVKLLQENKIKGTSEVWKARKGEQEFVIKLCELSEVGNQDYLNREVLAYSKLEGESFATFFGSGESCAKGKVFHYILLEFIKGERLFDLIVKESKGDEIDTPWMRSQGLSISKQIARSLRQVEQRGLIITDIKPENVIVSSFENKEKIVLIDLDSVCETGVEFKSVIAHRLCTPLYFSPEFALACKNAQTFKVEAFSSIFSFGVVLFEIFTQIEPFRAESLDEIIQKILEKEVPMSILVDRYVDTKLIETINKCLKKDPKERFQSFSEVCDALEQV